MDTGVLNRSTDWWENDGKVSSSRIGEAGVRFRLPSEIQKFDRLENLGLEGRCESFGRWLTNASLLKTISFQDFTSEYPFPFPPNIRKITVGGWRNPETCANYVISSLKQHSLASLQTLDCSDGRCGLEESHLETLLVDVLPKYPNLRQIDVTANSIKTISGLSSRLLNTIQECRVYGASSLRHLILTGNLVLEEDSHGLCQFLELFPSITDIGIDKAAGGYEEIRYQLDLNRAGRRLFPRRHAS